MRQHLDENPSASENLIAQLTKQGIKQTLTLILLRDLQPLIHETKGKLLLQFVIVVKSLLHILKALIKF